MARPWEKLGQAASLMQLTGVDAFGLVSMIVQAAHTARRNRELCQQLAQKVQIVSDLLGELQIPELRRHPKTRRPLDQLDEALFRAYKLVRSCSQQQESRSQLHQMLMGDDVATKLHLAKEEIDGYIILIPMITAVAAVKARGTQDVTEHETTYPSAPAHRLRLSSQEVTRLLKLEEPQSEDVVIICKNDGRKDWHLVEKVRKGLRGWSVRRFLPNGVSSSTGATTQIMEFPKWLRSFSYRELWQATHGFSEEMVGDFGGFYRGFLQDEGLHVVIMRVTYYMGEPWKKYIIVSSVSRLSRLRHPNLVQLVGWCDEADEVLLVYELCSNHCCLATLLHDPINILTWPVRYKIILRMCDALLYLHKGSVVLGDIRPSNVMIDSSFNPKLGAAGLAKLKDHRYVRPDAQGLSLMAYTDPSPGSRVNPYADIYSFGVILLEIACGRRPTAAFVSDLNAGDEQDEDPEQQQQEEEEEVEEEADCSDQAGSARGGGTENSSSSAVPLVGWVQGLYAKDALLDAADPWLEGRFEAREMERVLLVGLWCAHPDYYSRPNTDLVNKVLRNLEQPHPDLPRVTCNADFNAGFVEFHDPDLPPSWVFEE